MKKLIKTGFVLSALMGAVAYTIQPVQAQLTAIADQPEFPKLVAQPEDQAIRSGSNVTFTAQAENLDSYQWTRNGELIDGATNSSLTISNVTVGDAGYYAVYAVKDIEAVPSRSAALFVVTALDQGGMTIFGMPVASSGTKGTCPGHYTGYVNFTKTAALGWGWKPDTNTTEHTACDNIRSDTKIQYGGLHGDSDCDQTCVTLPNYPPSVAYRFAIYFTNNVPTTNYPITLTGFLP